MTTISEDINKNIPDSIVSPYMMNNPNQVFDVYSGPFKLSREGLAREFNGTIRFHWFPNLSVRFEGNAVAGEDNFEWINHDNSLELIVDDILFGKALVNYSFTGNSFTVSGTFDSNAVLGDKTITVDKVRFAIPNLRHFHGIPCKVSTQATKKVTMGRLIFENDEHIITIDQSPNFRQLEKALTEEGGYVTLYSGELKNKKGSIKLIELSEVILCFSKFLAFINGRRCSPQFLEGMFEDQVIWQSFSVYRVDQYKYVQSWPLKMSIQGLNDAWKKFSSLWKNSNDKDFLNTAVHWYTESNMNSGSLEGSIVMAQTALELIYNWLIIEKKKMLIGKDSESISAANKIRLILAHINVSTAPPINFQNLNSLINQNKEIVDGVDAFVQIRNSIIHSQEEKRKKILSMDPLVKYEAQQLALWYIELSLLYILEYKGKYKNRCSGGLSFENGEELVPFR